MLRHGPGLHKRKPQTADGNGISDLPSSIGNPTATLPQSIALTNITPDPSATAPIVTASAPSGLTTITETDTLVQSITSLNTVSTITTERVRTITDSSEYASLTSAAALSTSTKVRPTTSKASASATTSAAAAKSATNLSTLIPAIVVPLVVVLLASLCAFWFFMRRRHRRELASQPEFVMTGKGEKLSSRSNSGRSTTSNTQSGAEKPSPFVTQKELPAIQSPPSTNSEWPSAQIGVAQPFTPQETTTRRPYNPPFSSQPREPRQYRNFSGPGPGPGPRPATSGRAVPPPSNRGDATSSPYRNRSNSTPGQGGLPPLRTDSLETPRTAPSPVPRSGPARSPMGLPGNPNPNPNPRPNPNTTHPNPSAAFRFRDPSPSMNHNARSQAPGRLAAPVPGAYNGASSISQYSPIVKTTPINSRGPGVKRGPPPAINTSSSLSNNKTGKPLPPLNSASPQGNVLTEENVRIAKLANSSSLAYTPAEPSPSPKLPPPATRSQLIPRDSLQEDKDNFFGGSIGGSEQGRGQTPNSQPGPYWVSSNRASIVSEADDYEDIEAKSDVSSLNEFERFDFGPDVDSRTGSAAGASLNYFASQNHSRNGGGGSGSGSGSPFGNAMHERW
ncbi:hypothetical protein A1O3_09315 [Capronia epimyces CBS 606.96]|uniref:Uncharacterized protein n=1 Tax=Capronia epimyces CBS 606.96 TaxID=1182542 RepID=W9Y6V3_9EURO|nr:uncharacterized protein A1O3_09315 [Capronia epimyces CBS 606.96]EXJ78154.1 hypothetical protein A1O3_09315 [Capronia epimyces CBS 606.96]